MTNLPARSMTSAPFGTASRAAEPMRVILPLSIIMAASATAALPLPSMSVKFLSTLISPNAESENRIRREENHFMEPILLGLTHRFREVFDPAASGYVRRAGRL